MHLTLELSKPARFRALVAAALALASLGTGHRSIARGAPESSPPNVLVIVTDDQRKGLSMMPATRRLFRGEGIRFNNFFATTPQCCPSRASIMTGQYAHNHRVRSNHRVQSENLDHGQTVQHHLQTAGYTTGIFGKFLNSWPVKKDPPYFDEWAIHKGVEYFGGKWNMNGVIRNLDKSIYTTDYLRKKVAGFLNNVERDDERPWFLMVTPSAPHLPARPEKQYARAPVPKWRGNPAVFEKDLSDKPISLRLSKHGFKEAKAIRNRQFRSLPSADDLVERVFTRLEELGEGSNTLAFFLSDNGYLWGEHGLEGKGVPYTQAVKVPMMMRWPQRLTGGRRVGRMVATIDIAPTIMRAVRLRGDFAFDGRPLLGRASPARNRILTEMWRSLSRPTLAWASIRSRNFQYTEYYEVGRADPVITFREFYDLRDDPFQLNNLLGDGDLANDPGLARQLKLSRKLADYRRCTGSDCP